MQETQVQSLGLEDPLEKETLTHSSNSYLENSMDTGAWWATVHGPWITVHSLVRQEYGVSCHLLLHGIFPTQGLNLGLLHCR